MASLLANITSVLNRELAQPKNEVMREEIHTIHPVTTYQCCA